MVKQTIHLSIRASIRSSKHRLNAGAEISSFRRNVPNWLHRKLSKWHHFRCYQWQNCYQNHISISANRAKIATIINEPSKEPPSQSMDQYRKISNIVHTKPNFFSYRLAVIFAQYVEAKCQVKNEDVVGAAPTGDVPTTSELLTIYLPTRVRSIFRDLTVIIRLCSGNFSTDTPLFALGGDICYCCAIWHY